MYFGRYKNFDIARRPSGEYGYVFYLAYDIENKSFIHKVVLHPSLDGVMRETRKLRSVIKLGGE